MKNPNVFDRLTLLKRLDGDEELLEEVLSIYFEDVPVRLKNLRNALERGDESIAATEAHTLKGASANVGALELQAAALEIEKAVQKGLLT